MGATPQVIQVALRYDGKVFVPDQPFPHLPLGTVINVWTSPEPTDWPPGVLESIMGQGPDFEDPDDPPLINISVINPEWPKGYIERTMGSWVGPDMEDPDDPPFTLGETLS